jgi:hypothetical protein
MIQLWGFLTQPEDGIDLEATNMVTSRIQALAQQQKKTFKKVHGL